MTDREEFKLKHQLPLLWAEWRGLGKFLKKWRRKKICSNNFDSSLKYFVVSKGRHTSSGLQIVLVNATLMRKPEQSFLDENLWDFEELCALKKY